MRYVKEEINTIYHVEFDRETLTEGTAIKYKYKGNDYKNGIIIYNGRHGLQIVGYGYFKKSKHVWLPIEDYISNELKIRILK